MIKMFTQFGVGIILSMPITASASPAAVVLPTSSALLESEKPKTSFHDLEKDHWAYTALNRLVANGVINAYSQSCGQGKFLMSRYEFAVIVGTLINPQRADAIIDDEYIVKAIAQLGTSNGPLSPERQKQSFELMRALCMEFYGELRSVGLKQRTGCGSRILSDRISPLNPEMASGRHLAISFHM